MPTSPGGARPSALDLARLSDRAVFPGGAELYRGIARFAELEAGREFLVTPCGRGGAARFLAELTGAAGAGADPDPALVEAAHQAARRDGLADRLHFEHAAPEDLPYKDEVFDVAIAEPGLAAAAEPAAALRELVRVTKPLGAIVLIQPTWSGQPQPEERELVHGRLGVRPFLVVEWKQMLRDAGVVELSVEDVSRAAAGLGQPLGSLGGLADVARLGDKVAVLRRAWAQWGWSGVRQLLGGEPELRALLEGSRLLGVSLIRGRRWTEPPSP